MSLEHLSATEAAKLIATRAISCEEYVRACLHRIELLEPKIQAWAYCSPQQVLEQARKLDKQPILGPIHGVPIGIKDILDTADMPTEMGSAIYKGYRPKADAYCVTAIRASGGIVLGKTVTAEFAYVAPGPTTNPHNTAHTPGGSSSGSAAAVATHMTPIALGTQTGGSVIRPASYCGVIGFKPTFNRVNRAGLKFGAESLDTIGYLARTLDDIALIDCVLAGDRKLASIAKIARPPRIGLCRTFLWDQAATEYKKIFEDTAQRLAVAGADVADMELPRSFLQLNDVRDTINNVERARAGAWEWNRHRNDLSPQLSECMEKGWHTSELAYSDAVKLCVESRVAVGPVFSEFDVLLTPSTEGEAPHGLHSTGKSTFQWLWTLLHLPAVTLPVPNKALPLPIGIQLVAAHHNDRYLLSVAEWVSTILNA